jgi:hypothetical protein
VVVAFDFGPLENAFGVLVSGATAAELAVPLQYQIPDHVLRLMVDTPRQN